jgi:ATP phosphoribosyltransferase regulatory subunit
VTLFMDAVLQALPATPPARRLYLPHGTPAAAAARLRAQGWIAVAGLDPAADPRVEAPRLGCSHVLSGETITAATETAGEGS